MVSVRISPHRRLRFAGDEYSSSKPNSSCSPLLGHCKDLQTSGATTLTSLWQAVEGFVQELFVTCAATF